MKNMASLFITPYKDGEKMARIKGKYLAMIKILSRKLKFGDFGC